MYHESFASVLGSPSSTGRSVVIPGDATDLNSSKAKRHYYGGVKLVRKSPDPNNPNEKSRVIITPPPQQQQDNKNKSENINRKSLNIKKQHQTEDYIVPDDDGVTISSMSSTGDAKVSNFQPPKSMRHQKSSSNSRPSKPPVVAEQVITSGARSSTDSLDDQDFETRDLQLSTDTVTYPDGMHKGLQNYMPQGQGRRKVMSMDFFLDDDSITHNQVPQVQFFQYPNANGQVKTEIHNYDKPRTQAQNPPPIPYVLPMGLTQGIPYDPSNPMANVMAMPFQRGIPYNPQANPNYNYNNPLVMNLPYTPGYINYSGNANGTEPQPILTRSVNLQTSYRSQKSVFDRSAMNSIHDRKKIQEIPPLPSKREIGMQTDDEDLEITPTTTQTKSRDLIVDGITSYDINDLNYNDTNIHNKNISENNHMEKPMPPIPSDQATITHKKSQSEKIKRTSSFKKLMRKLSSKRSHRKGLSMNDRDRGISSTPSSSHQSPIIITRTISRDDSSIQQETPLNVESYSKVSSSNRQEKINDNYSLESQGSSSNTSPMSSHDSAQYFSTDNQTPNKKVAFDLTEESKINQNQNQKQNQNQNQNIPITVNNPQKQKTKSFYSYEKPGKPVLSVERISSKDLIKLSKKDKSKNKHKKLKKFFSFFKPPSLTITLEPNDPKYRYIGPNGKTSKVSGIPILPPVSRSSEDSYDSSIHQNLQVVNPKPSLQQSGGSFNNTNQISDSFSSSSLSIPPTVTSTSSSSVGGEPDNQWRR